MGTFCYRDVFFALVPSADLKEVRLGVEGDEKVHIKTWTTTAAPSLLEVRQACDQHIDKLLNNVLVASGDVECETCGRLLKQHPIFRGERDWNGLAYLHRRCDGRLLKL